MTAITTASGLACTPSASTLPGAEVTRRLTPEAGRAMEKLGHAIEYLSDEFVNADGVVSGHDARLDAIQILMSLNRQVYLESPEVPRLAGRLSSWLRRFA